MKKSDYGCLLQQELYDEGVNSSELRGNEFTFEKVITVAYCSCTKCYAFSFATRKEMQQELYDEGVNSSELRGNEFTFEKK